MVYEMIQSAVTALISAGFAGAVLWFFVRRYIEGMDERLRDQARSDNDLGRALEEVEADSLQRDQKLQQEVYELRQYCDNEFVRQRDVDRVESRLDKMSDKLDQQFQRLFDLIVEVTKS